MEKEESKYLTGIKKICKASESETERIVYSTDSSTIKGDALLVAWPENADNLQKLIRYVTKQNIGLTIRGGGTSLVGSAVPQNTVVVDMAYFNKIKKIDLKEEAATVESGVVLDELNDVLAKYDYEFSSKPGGHAACTIGGMIATNAAGMLTLRHGRVVDQVMEMNIMDGTGKTFTIKGDEIKEFAGTEGAVAIILDAKLKINKKKELFDGVYEFNDISQLIGKLNELKNDTDVVAIEYINAVAAEISKLHPMHYLLVKYSSQKGNIDRQKAAKLWKLRENLYSVLVETGFPRIEDPLIPEENIEKFLSWLHIRNIPAYGHISSGIFHPHFRREQKKEICDMIEAVKQLNGKLAGEHGIGILKKNFSSLFGSIKRIQNLKEKYDPFNILNRGKFR